MPKSAGGWRFSRLSVVFDILTLSSHTLTKLQLDLPQKLTTENSVKATGDYICTMLAKLSAFPHLREVELKALPWALELVSKSENKNLKLSSHSRDYGACQCEWCEPSGPDLEDVSLLLPMSRVIRDANFFTGGQISRLVTTRPYRSPFLEVEALQSLESSAETLEELDVDVCQSVLIGLSNLVVRCPHLTSFRLFCHLHDVIGGNENWRVGLPVQRAQEARSLKTLAISITQGPGRIVINEAMLKWIGFSLEDLLLKNDLNNALSGEARQLHNLIQNVSLTLSSLEIEGLYDPITLSQSLSGSATSLSNIKKLSLFGNAGLINGFISAFNAAHLTHLKLRKYSGAEDRVEVDKVYKVVRETSISLEVLHLSGWVNGSTIEGSRFEPMDFPNLIKLSLSFLFEDETGPFSRSKLPKLKKLELFDGLQAFPHLFPSVLSQLHVE